MFYRPFDYSLFSLFLVSFVSCFLDLFVCAIIRLRFSCFVCTFVSFLAQINIHALLCFFVSCFPCLCKCLDKHFFASCFIGLNIPFVKYCYYRSYGKSPNFHMANIRLFIRFFVYCFICLRKYSFKRFFVSRLQVSFAGLFVHLRISTKAQTKKSAKQQTGKTTDERKFFKRIVYFIL